MSLLLDENLSPRLVSRLSLLFPGITHVREIGLQRASDRDIWEYAKRNNQTIVSADADFVQFVQQQGAPPKVIHLHQCTFPFAVIDEILRTNAVRIAEFEKDDRAALLVIRS